jgi:predicted secreted protein
LGTKYAAAPTRADNAAPVPATHHDTATAIADMTACAASVRMIPVLARLFMAARSRSERTSLSDFSPEVLMSKPLNKTL